MNLLRRLMREKRMAVNAILNMTKNVLGIIFPLITYPYVSRVLGVDNLGIYNFSYSIVSYFLLIAAFGISTYGIREGTQYRENKREITRFVSEIFSINLISTVIAYILLFLLIYNVPFLYEYKLIIQILSLEILFTTLGSVWICNIYEDFLFIAIRTIAMQIVSLVLIFVLVKSEHDLVKYVAVLLVSNSGANFLNFFYVRKKYCKFRPTLKVNWKRHLKPIFIIFSTTVAITIYVSSDTTMLGIMTSDYQVGLYGTAVKIYTIIKNILAAILMVIIPRFSMLLSNDRENEAKILFMKIFDALSVLMLPMIIGLFMLSDDIVILISGAEYAGSAASLRLLSIAIIFSLYSYMFTQCILIPARREDCVFKATLFSAAANILLNIVLIPYWGINAAAATTIIAEVITFCISLIYSKRYIKIYFPLKNMISVIGGCIVVIFVCIFFRNIHVRYVRVVLSVLISAILYFGVLLAIRNNRR